MYSTRYLYSAVGKLLFFLKRGIMHLVIRAPYLVHMYYDYMTNIWIRRHLGFDLYVQIYVQNKLISIVGSTISKLGIK